jgi:hypothetical protein
VALLHDFRIFHKETQTVPNTFEDIIILEFRWERIEGDSK